MSMGFEKTRLASLLHTGHVIDVGAVPSGRVISNTPSRSHRYSYGATAVLSEYSRLQCQFADFGTWTPCFTWCGFSLDGATSKSKIRLGM
jgi:hypothetical protein